MIMATSKRVEGPTPTGAAYAIIFYQDEEGEPIEATAATHAELIEYTQEGLHVFRTYVNLKPFKEANDDDFTA